MEEKIKTEIPNPKSSSASDSTPASRYWGTPGPVTPPTPDLTGEQMASILAKEQQREKQRRLGSSGRAVRKMVQREPYDLKRSKAHACLRRASKLSASVKSLEIVEDEICHGVGKMDNCRGIAGSGDELVLE